MKPTPLHTYTLNYEMFLLTSVMIDGSPVTITFKDGFREPFRKPGTFSTDDPVLIKAIETDERFGRQWKRTSPTYNNEPSSVREPITEDTPVNPPVIDTPEEETSAVIPQTLPVETAPAAPETPAPAAPQLTPVPGITSGQKARAYILSKYEEVKSTDLRTNAAIKAIAEEKGITFPDWIEQ